MILQTCVNFFKSFTIFDSLNGKPVFFLVGILKFLDLFHCILAYFSLLLVLVLIQEEWYSLPCIFGMPSMAVILHNYLQCRLHNLAPCLLGVLQNIQCYCSCCLTRSYKLTYFFQILKNLGFQIAFFWVIVFYCCKVHHNPSKRVLVPYIHQSNSLLQIDLNKLWLTCSF